MQRLLKRVGWTVAASLVATEARLQMTTVTFHVRGHLVCRRRLLPQVLPGFVRRLSHAAYHGIAAEERGEPLAPPPAQPVQLVPLHSLPRGSVADNIQRQLQEMHAPQGMLSTKPMLCMALLGWWSIC